MDTFGSGHRVQISVRSGSFLETFKKSFEDIILFLFFWNLPWFIIVPFVLFRSFGRYTFVLSRLRRVCINDWFFLNLWSRLSDWRVDRLSHHLCLLRWLPLFLFIYFRSRWIPYIRIFVLKIVIKIVWLLIVIHMWSNVLTIQIIRLLPFILLVVL